MWADELYDPEFYDVDKPTEQEKNKNFDKPDYKDLYYQSNTALNKPIINAVTGEVYKYRLGTEDVKRFYVVVRPDPYDPKEACHLFFSSPAQSERYDGIPVSQYMIDRFNKNKEYFRLKDSKMTRH
jgi:hypothetical protein